MDQHISTYQVPIKLTMFIQQRCGCPFPASNITTPQFTCHQSHERHVTYRASVSTGSLLVAALEEWPRVHRSILLQGGRLSVDDTCPVIIQSLDEEECEVPSQPAMPMVALNTYLATVMSVVLIAVVVVIVSCTFRIRRRLV